MGNTNNPYEIVFYCGVGETKWNYHSVQPGKHVCVSPVYGKTETRRKENRIPTNLSRETLVIQDSGAFSDGPNFRLTAEEALNRQKFHANKYNYWELITFISSYDLLIDERWENGIRFKSRWDDVVAVDAVEETINNARFLSSQNLDGKGRILTAQGVSPSQYRYCVSSILPFCTTDDILGLGGWCIVGKMRKKLLPVLAETCSLIFPHIAVSAIKQVHLWGVIYPEALAEVAFWCRRFNLRLSTDSVGPSIYPCFGNWGYGKWRDKNYIRPNTDIRGLERARHVKATKSWLASFNIEEYLNPKFNYLRH